MCQINQKLTAQLFSNSSLLALHPQYTSHLTGKNIRIRSRDNPYITAGRSPNLYRLSFAHWMRLMMKFRKINNHIELYSLLNHITCYAPIYPTKSSIHSLFNSWTCDSSFHDIIESHNNICTNSVLQCVGQVSKLHKNSCKGNLKKNILVNIRLMKRYDSTNQQYYWEHMIWK